MAHQESSSAASASLPWLAATGDVVVQRPPHGCDERLRTLLAESTVAVGNLEIPLTTRGPRAEKAATHRADPKLATEVRDLGLDVVTLANNHMLDFGGEGLDDTVAALDGVGVGHCGAGTTDVEAREPLYRSTPAGIVALVGLCAALPPGFAAGPARAGVAPLRALQQVAVDPALATEQPGMAPYVHTRAYEPDLDAACAVVRTARTNAHLVVVAVHWGVPFGFAPPSYGVLAEYQRPTGHALVDAGADLVVGHHPHAVHPVEQYGGGLIAYSVGNYLFHNWADFAPSAGDPTFSLQVPSSPYHNPFGAAETHDSVVVTVLPPEAGHELTVRFVPTTMSDGDPIVPTEKHAEAILWRLAKPVAGPPGTDAGTVPAIEIRRDDRTGMTIGEVTLERDR